MSLKLNAYGAFILFAIVLITSSCSKQSSSVIEIEPKPDTTAFSLSTKQTTVKAFEQINININWLNDDSAYLNRKYDSVVAFSGAGDTSLLVYNSRLIFLGFSTSFYYPGTYKLYLKGYLGGQIRAEDSLAINVVKGVPNFLFEYLDSIYAINKLGIIPPNIFQKSNFELRRVPLPTNKAQYFLYWRSYYIKTDPSDQRQEFLRLMNNFYGKPLYTTADGAKMTNYFKNNFGDDWQHTRQESIWEGDQFNVALLESDGGYFLYARQK